MASRRENQRKRQISVPSVPTASIRDVKLAVATGPANYICGLRLHAFVFPIAFVLVCARRPDALLNPQFYAEDGTVWYTQAYQLGAHSLLIPEAGYLHALIRLVTLFTLAFPFATAPLVMNVCAIVVQVLPVNLLLSSRFSFLSFRTRLLANLSYLALPNSFEINANITNVQWHLCLLACLLLLARLPESPGWRAFDGIVLGLAALSSPISVLLVPVAAVLWWNRRNRWSAVSLGVLLAGALVEVLVALLSHSRVAMPLGAAFPRLVVIMARQVFFSSLVGLDTQTWLLQATNLYLVEILIAAVGTGLVLYAVLRGPLELRLFIGFAFGVLALGLARPLAGLPTRAQWVWLCVPGCGNRYYFMPMLAFLASLFWIATRRAEPRALRLFAAALLLLLPIGIYQDWNYTPFVDYHFAEYAEQFQHAPLGTVVVIPINPNVSMKLTKR